MSDLLPKDILQLLAIIVAVVPGFVYQISRRRVRGPGPDEQSISIRVLRSIATSLVFVCLYIAVLDYPPANIPVGTDRLPLSWKVPAVGVLLLALVIPWLAARIIYYLETSALVIKMTSAVFTKFKLRSQWDPTPSAWDFAFTNRRAGWVRVQTSDGTWMGGWFGGESFASSYPEPREIYLEQGYAMNGSGVFTGEISAPNGLYIRCDEVRLLDFATDVDDAKSERGNTGADEPPANEDNGATRKEWK